jgi:type IV secretory pathway ATPase VirB11/archaellum biosynthesis ATPase
MTMPASPGPQFVTVVDVPEREDRFYVFARTEDASAFVTVLREHNTYTIGRYEPLIDATAAQLLIQAERDR